MQTDYFPENDIIVITVQNTNNRINLVNYICVISCKVCNMQTFATVSVFLFPHIQ